MSAYQIASKHMFWIRNYPLNRMDIGTTCSCFRNHLKDNVSSGDFDIDGLYLRHDEVEELLEFCADCKHRLLKTLKVDTLVCCFEDEHYQKWTKEKKK